MPSWKKILQSGSAVHVLNITASSLPNVSQHNVIGYNTTSGTFTYFSTSSLVSGGSLIGGSGTANYITRWSGGTTITTSSIYESSGNIGIGTTSPTSRLQVRGSGATSTTTALRVENSSTAVSLVVLDNGNVGIGTTTPSASLHVEGNFQISTGSLYTYGQNTDIDSGSIRTVMSVSTGSYRAAFFDYVLNKSTNARAGTVFSVWNGTSVEWNDVSTNDIGNTAEINLSVGLSGANVVLYASSSTNDWSMKALSRMI